MISIYVYRRSRSVQADITLPDGVILLATYRVWSQSDASRIKANPGALVPERITALIDRFYDDLPAKNAGMSTTHRSGVSR
jgi:hypothetical protein